MKKITLAVLALMAMPIASMAQHTSYVSTNNKEMNTTTLTTPGKPFALLRTLMAGYNTICLPMSLTAEQLQAAAPGVQLERLAGIGQEGDVVQLYFIDCTAQGLQAGVPYLIYSPTTQLLHVKSDKAGKVNLELKTVKMTDQAGNAVSFASSWQATQGVGRYGIPAQQDALVLESVLIRTEGDKVFLPTRCGFDWEAQSATASQMQIKHITTMNGTATRIDQLEKSGAQVDVYDTKGALVKAHTTIEQARHTLPAGIYVVQGEKWAVK